MPKSAALVLPDRKGWLKGRSKGTPRPGRASLTRCTMKRGEGFVELLSMPDRISKMRKVLEGESRRWSAVSQRVPRDAHQRFVKTDVLGRRHRIPGEEMPCWPPGSRISDGTRADIEKRPLRHEGQSGVGTSKSPERDRPKHRAAKLCHGERFNGCVGTRLDSRAQRRR